MPTRSGVWISRRAPGEPLTSPCHDSSAISSRGPTSPRPRTVSHAATQAEASWWSHQIGAGRGAGETSTPATRTPSLVAKYSEPLPRGRATRSIHCSRVSLTTCHRAFPGAHPIAQAHGSIGAAPTRHSQRSPSMLAGPGPNLGLNSSPPNRRSRDSAHCHHQAPQAGPRPRLNRQGKSVIPTTRTTSWRAGSRDHARPGNPVLAGAGATRSPARARDRTRDSFHVERLAAVLIRALRCRRRAHARAGRRRAGRGGSGSRGGGAWRSLRTRSRG